MPFTAITATPSALKKAYPCLYALSSKEILAIMVHCLRVGASTVETGAQLNANAACFEGQLVKKDFLVAMAAIFINALITPAESVSQLAKDTRCSRNASEHKLQAQFVYLVSKYYQASV